MMIDCPVCGQRVQVLQDEIATHNEPVHVDSTKTTTVRVYVKCGASEARVEVRARRRA